jgi:hypothetical protein
MKKRYDFFLYVIFFLISLNHCSYKIPQEIPLGEWQYIMLVNGIEVGTAKSSNKIIDNKYVLHSELKMGLGSVVNMSKQTIIETLDFIPLRLENHNTIINDGNKQKIDTVATFKGQAVELIVDDQRVTITLDKEFRLEGNYILAKLIEGRFKEGLTIEINIYDPTIEQGFPIPIKITVKGIKSVKLGDESVRLIHITESIANVKSIDLYIDERGVMIKTVIKMLNTTIELIKE